MLLEISGPNGNKRAVWLDASLFEGVNKVKAIRPVRHVKMRVKSLVDLITKEEVIKTLATAETRKT